MTRTVPSHPSIKAPLNSFQQQTCRVQSGPRLFCCWKHTDIKPGLPVLRSRRGGLEKLPSHSAFPGPHALPTPWAHKTFKAPFGITVAKWTSPTHCEDTKQGGRGRGDGRKKSFGCLPVPYSTTPAQEASPTHPSVRPQYLKLPSLPHLQKANVPLVCVDLYKFSCTFKSHHIPHQTRCMKDAHARTHCLLLRAAGRPAALPSTIESPALWDKLILGSGVVMADERQSIHLPTCIITPRKCSSNECVPSFEEMQHPPCICV